MTNEQYHGPERRGQYSLALESRLSILHDEVSDIKSAIKELTSAITRLTLVEERMATTSAAQERALKAIAEMEKKVVEIEKILAAQTKTANWLDRGIYAALAALGVYVLKKVGML